MIDNLRYPTGPFRPVPLTPDVVTRCVAALAGLPAELQRAVADLGDAQLDTPYRPGGWTVRQVVHHLVDSHANAWCRMRLTMTEVRPTIRTYDEKAWADLADARRGPIDPSLRVLEGLHQRWSAWLAQLEPADWERRFYHPEAGEQTLGWLLQMYAWHGRHHTAHITGLREREGW